MLHIYRNKKTSCKHLLIRSATGTLFPANNYPVTKVLFQLQPLCEFLYQLWMEVLLIHSVYCQPTQPLLKQPESIHKGPSLYKVLTQRHSRSVRFATRASNAQVPI